MYYSISPMKISDYDEVYALWSVSKGIGLSDADTSQAIQRYLEANPSGSFVARDTHGKLIGAVLCGSDSRRGYLHHLAVAESARKSGVGRELVEHCMQALKARGITRCHIFVYRDNQEGSAFWEKIGWVARQDLQIMSRDIKEPGEASSPGC